MKKSSKKPIIVIFFILACLAYAGARFWYLQYLQHFPTTTQAVIKANIIPVTSPLNGIAAVIYAKPQTLVKRGDILIELDNTPLKTALAKAESNLAKIQQDVKGKQNLIISAENAVQKTQQEVSDLSKANFQMGGGDSDLTGQLRMAKQNLDTAFSELNESMQQYGQPGEALTQLKVAQQAVSAAQARLQYSYLAAPNSGLIRNIYIKSGAHIVKNQNLCDLIENNAWWVDAQFTRPMLKYIRINQPVVIKLNPYNSIAGSIAAINQNLVRIKILNPNLQPPLQIGTRVSVAVDTQISRR